MSYESLIRRIYQSGRDLKNGADASVYRKYEQCRNLYQKQKEALENKQPPLSASSLDELEYDMRVAKTKIALNVERALRYAEKTYSHKLDDQQLKTLQECRNNVSPPDPRKVDESIDKANEILMAIELYPR